MKIKCSYCGAAFDDVKTHCPQCGAPNEGVVRTTSDEPLTIEQLQEWYKSKGLPPYETTRFFIGIDYKQPRAFGIYKDEDTGNVVVYKNKNNGERAIRYQGTDEAYGVNEIYQRLKQEIIQQKMNNVKKGETGVSSNTESVSFGDCLSSLLKMGAVMAGIVGIAAAFIIGIGSILVATTPKDGYYNYQDTYYYYDDSGYNDKYVFEYDENAGNWKSPVGKKDDPGIFSKKSKCKKYYLSADYDSSYSCTNINDAAIYKDFIASGNIMAGYYKCGSRYYYHHGYNYYSDWYYYDSLDDWKPVNTDALPADLSHASSVNDFYYTPTWDESTQFTDFEDSDEFEQNYSSQEDDNDYSWDSSDSWDSGFTDFDSDW